MFDSSCGLGRVILIIWIILSCNGILHLFVCVSRRVGRCWFQTISQKAGWIIDKIRTFEVAMES